jgi:diguanylate cyclase (GGDEF)-like protein/PAS domain S-box-containing protein
MHWELEGVLEELELSARNAPDLKRWKTFLRRIDALLQGREGTPSSSKGMDAPLSSKERLQRRLETLIEVIPDLIFYVDEEGTYLEVLSSRNEELLYRPREEIIGKRINEIFSPQYATPFLEATRKAIQTSTLQILQYSMEVQGEQRHFEARIMPTNLRERGKLTTIAIVRDITAVKRSTDYLNVIKKIFEEATEGIFITKLTGEYFEANDAFFRILGIEPGALPGPRLEDFAKHFDPEVLREIRRSLDEEGSFRGEIFFRDERGRDKLIWLSIDSIYDQAGGVEYRVAMLTDITELQASREMLHYTATHDTLTDLPNRRLVHERLGEAIERSLRSGKSGALLFIDLDNFKEINDTVGHSAGDRVLVECARRIRSVTGKEDLLGRFGGDEFLLVMEDLHEPQEALEKARRIIEVLKEPMERGRARFEIGASIGIALFPRDSTDIDQLIQYADMAMYRVKEEGRNNALFFSEELDQKLKERYRIEQLLKRTIRERGFHLLYQPQWDLLSKRIIGMEALIRLKGPRQESLPPGTFIPIAEESELIEAIGAWVLEESCRQLQAWKARYETVPRLALNLSRSQLKNASLPRQMEAVLQRYDLEASAFELEITETTFMHLGPSEYRVLEELQAMGFRLSIDDFGTGFSSLSNLKQFNVDKIKIDRSFIDELEKSESDRAITQASINLAHALGLKTVAEGVETPGQLALLQSMGCDEVQGFLFSHPLPSEELEAYLQENEDQCRLM